ncbi:MAG: VOC family protein [Pseudomonadota bacterium]
MFRITELLHVSLLVSDLEQARVFYEDVLGLAPLPERPPLPFPGVWYATGRQQIHLIALPNPDKDAPRPEHGGRDRHAAFAVTDLDRLRQALEAAQVPYTLSRSDRRALFCRDPEGNALEFVEAG